MKRRLFSAALASIVALCLFGAVGAKEQPLRIGVSHSNQSYVEVTGSRAAMIAFAIEWQEQIWPGWQNSDHPKAPTVKEYVDYIDECLAQGHAACFYAKGKPFEQAVSVAFLKASK